MPTITDIQRQQKRADRYSIFIDDQYSFSCSDLDLSNSRLEIGQRLTSSSLASLKERFSSRQAKDRAMNYLAIRPRSRQELSDYLGRKDYPAETIAAVLTELEAKRYLDDEQFARDWVAMRQRSRPRSRIHLTQELRQKGLSDEIIEKALAGSDEIEAIAKLIDKKRSRYPTEEKLRAHLLSKGFGYGAVQKVLRAVDDEELPDQDES